MRVNVLTIEREEKLSDVFSLPGGRQLTAQLDVSTTVFAANDSSTPQDTHTLVVEVKQPGGQFEPVARSAALVGGGTVSVPIPPLAEPVEYGEMPPVFRLRLLHVGRRNPGIVLQVKGL